MGVLVVDVGSSSVRASVVQPDGTVAHVHAEPVVTSSPAPSFVEVDASSIATSVLSVARATLADAGAVEGVGIADQRATTVLWDRSSGEPVGPAISWQDLRTVVTCLMLRDQGVLLAPNESATKLAFLLDLADPERARDLCFGTVDSWIAWTLSSGALHVTDATNAAVTGLRTPDGKEWDPRVLDALRIPESVLPEVVDSSGAIGEASALEGSPPICGIVGDQQASLVGQGCTLPGLAKITFGTGGFLDSCVGPDRPTFARRGRGGTFPIAAWQRSGRITWGVEAIMLSAGSCIDWLRDDLGLIETAADTDGLAASVADSGDTWFVPAFFGIGTPVWDFGARGAFVGITRGTGRAEMVRAVLEGIAHRGCDLVEAAETDTGIPLGSLRVDGGMSANATFLQALADFSGRRVEVAPVTECTTLGAAYMAGMELGLWRDEKDVASSWRPRHVVDPRLGANPRQASRERWLAARDRARQTIPELSAVQFWDA
ncbi:MAG: FGGY family carbohydrate kinase [Acidimicrobiales bacterium]